MPKQASLLWSFGLTKTFNSCSFYFDHGFFGFDGLSVPSVQSVFVFVIVFVIAETKQKAAAPLRGRAADFFPEK